ncbi:MAG: 6,7-dimethyl-8-ribityllumazine synthase [Planctomycetes bacterium]|nr:6,7-dimethyl-8-ribityllumazine synthase [Planctomycetota bacterium]
MSVAASHPLHKVALVVSVYNATVTDPLRKAAIAEFLRRGGKPENLLTYEVHGSFEIPVVAEAIMHAHQQNGVLLTAVVCLGCIIKGDTRHDEILGDVVTQELSSLAVRHRTPIGLGVLTVNTNEQALARAGGDKGNKGQEAMSAALDAAHAVHAARHLQGAFHLSGDSPDKLRS